MDFNLKNYQIFKLKKYFKKNEFLLLFHSSKLNSVKWLTVEQTLKKLKLNYYKPLNGTSLKTFKESIYKNFSPIVAGFILFVKAQYKTTCHNLPEILKNVKPSFILISVKLNNKVYSSAQLKGMEDLSYKKTMFTFYRSLDKHLKTTYVLTDTKSKNSK